MLRSKADLAGEGQRSIALHGRQVDYHLRRSSRRTIGLSIDQRGLRVGAPLRAGLGDIETLILKHADWVLQKLDGWQQRAPEDLVVIRDGLVLPCFGQALTISLARGANRVVWLPDGSRLTLCLAAEASPKHLLERALRERARLVFAQRLAFYAARLGVAVPALTLSSARTRWGSCSTRSGIRLNWRLIFFPLAVVDYVVAHELAHLREMNHSPRFWSVVEGLYPDWRRQRAELKRLAHSLPKF